jgi:hypothetical protein
LWQGLVCGLGSEPRSDNTIVLNLFHSLPRCQLKSLDEPILWKSSFGCSRKGNLIILQKVQ